MLDEEKCLRTEQKELLIRLKREQAWHIAKIEIDILELGPGNEVGETTSDFMTAMKEWRAQRRTPSTRSIKKSHQYRPGMNMLWEICR